MFLPARPLSDGLLGVGRGFPVFGLCVFTVVFRILVYDSNDFADFNLSSSLPPNKYSPIGDSVKVSLMEILVVAIIKLRRIRDSL